MTVNMAEAAGWYAVAFVLFLAWFPAYLLALSCVASPFSAPLRRRAVQVTLWSLVFAAPVAYVVFRRWFFAGVFFVEGIGWVGQVAPGLFVLFGLLACLNIYSMTVSLTALRSAPVGSVARSKARSYAIAFITFDVGWFAYAALVLSGTLGLNAGNLAGATLDVVFFVLLSYGILKHQVFDIDLKIKWTIRRGTVAGIFVAAFLVAFAVAEQFLQAQYGWLVGGVAVGVLLIALRPIERAADRLANATMPNVRDSADYRMVKKRDVYRATVEGALFDGTISERERDMLDRLQDELGLTATETRAIERAAATASGKARRTA